MKRMNMNARIILFLFIVGLACIALPVSAEETEPAAGYEEAAAAPEEFHFPTIEPEISLTGGFRYAHIDDSKEAMEFEYFRNSPTFGSEVRIVSYPHRLHLDLDFQNERDYYGDLTYAYKDLLYFRGVNSTLYHNLENITLYDLGPGTTFEVERRDKNEEYGIKVGISNLLLRLKTPDYPAHLYAEANFVTKDGTRQQRFMGGNGAVGRGARERRISEKREIDWTTSVYTIGANAHLGPVEMDFSHSEKRFDVNDDHVMKNYYLSNETRVAGVYEHNLIPETKSSANTLKIHTTQTGRLTAAATLSQVRAENRDSGASSDTFYGSGEVTWLPMHEVAVFFKYRHVETDFDNPDSVTIKAWNLAGTEIARYTFTDIRDSIQSVRDTFTGSVRIRPFKGLMVRSELSYEDTRRKDFEAWHEQMDTQKTTFVLSGDLHIMKGLMFKTKYTHIEIDNPSVNVEPNRSDAGYFSLSWTPTPKLTAFASYNIGTDRREQLHFLDREGEEYDGDNRNVTHNRFVGMVSYLPLRNLSLTATYSYFRQKVVQNLNNNLPVDTDATVPYKTSAQSVSFDVMFRPIDHLTLTGGASYTVSASNFYPSKDTLLDPVSINSFSDSKVREMAFTASGDYQFKHGMSAGIEYRYASFNEAIHNIYNELEDGRAQIVLLKLTKKW